MYFKSSKEKIYVFKNIYIFYNNFYYYNINIMNNMNNKQLLEKIEENNKRIKILYFDYFRKVKCSDLIKEIDLYEKSL